MALFQKSVLNKHLNNLDDEKLVQAFAKFQSNYNPSKIKNLKKQKVTLSLIQQDEWEDYFNTYKTEINNLQTQITQTDQQIDQMIYELYGLTDEEIRIVENV